MKIISFLMKRDFYVFSYSIFEMRVNLEFLYISNISKIFLLVFSFPDVINSYIFDIVPE